MEMTHFIVFDSWLKLFCPTCLTEEDRTALSIRGTSAKAKSGSWLKLFCPTCLTEKDRTREEGFLAEAFMSSGNGL